SKDGTIVVNVDVKNVGNAVGQEVIQVYAGCRNSKSKIDRPFKELKGFTKITIGPGKQQHATIEIPVSQLTYYDEASRSFVVEPGEHAILVGPSAQNDTLKEIKVIIE
nr:fibronectin type III-like domain-contianing protein [Candidatus Sigynarchaeota archaeon]